MIQTKLLTKKYGDFTAVEDLNLSIVSGELFSLLGINGAGKTTTIKMFSCLIRPTSVNALILNKRMDVDPQFIKLRISGWHQKCGRGTSFFPCH